MVSGFLLLVADSLKSPWSPHGKRNAFSERCLNGLNFQIKSRKFPALLWIYTEGEGDLRGTGMREVARPGEMETDRWTNSRETKLEGSD